MNHCLLNCIGVSHPMLDRVVTLASSCGLAAKLTGAGGGGCALLLLDVGKPTLLFAHQAFDSYCNI